MKILEWSIVCEKARCSCGNLVILIDESNLAVILSGVVVAISLRDTCTMLQLYADRFHLGLVFVSSAKANLLLICRVRTELQQCTVADFK